MDIFDTDTKFRKIYLLTNIFIYFTDILLIFRYSHGFFLFPVGGGGGGSQVEVGGQGCECAVWARVVVEHRRYIWEVGHGWETNTHKV